MYSNNGNINKVNNKININKKQEISFLITKLQKGRPSNR